MYGREVIESTLLSLLYKIVKYESVLLSLPARIVVFFSYSFYISFLSCNDFVYFVDVTLVSAKYISAIHSGGL